MTNLAKTYGGALYALAQEEKMEEQLLEQLKAVCALLQENPDYTHLIESRTLTKAERLKLLDEAFASQVHEYLLSFMKILCERGAFSQMQGCLDAYVKGYNESHGIMPAKVITAEVLTDDQRKRLIAALEKKTGKTVVIDVKVDPSIGGGLRVEMEGMRYDNTVASKLEGLRRALSAQS